MSAARFVPETVGLDGEDARTTLTHVGRGRLLKDAFVRLRAADGTSHARSLAFLTALVLVQGVIAVVGLASTQSGTARNVGVQAVHDLAPGPAGELLTQAVDQAGRVGSSGRLLALVLGGLGALVTSVTLFGQIERATNRVYGVEQDRPSVRKYLRAFALAVTAGLLAGLAFTSMAVGAGLGAWLSGTVLGDAWRWLRWPVGFLLLSGATALVMKYSPRRHQPTWSWLSYGGTLAVLLSAAASGLLALFFRVSTSFGQTYGPLAGMIGLLLWANASAIAALYGVSVAAQLEAVRAGVPGPRDETATQPTIWASSVDVRERVRAPRHAAGGASPAGTAR